MTENNDIDSLGDAVDEFRRRTNFKELANLKYRKEEGEKSKWVAIIFVDSLADVKYAVTFKREWHGGFGRHFRGRGAPL